MKSVVLESRGRRALGSCLTLTLAERLRLRSWRSLSYTASSREDHRKNGNGWRTSSRGISSPSSSSLSSTVLTCVTSAPALHAQDGEGCAVTGAGAIPCACRRPCFIHEPIISLSSAGDMPTQWTITKNEDRERHGNVLRLDRVTLWSLDRRTRSEICQSSPRYTQRT
jgi:hypothetical protein